MTEVGCKPIGSSSTSPDGMAIRCDPRAQSARREKKTTAIAPVAKTEVVAKIAKTEAVVNGASDPKGRNDPSGQVVRIDDPVQ